MWLLDSPGSCVTRSSNWQPLLYWLYIPESSDEESKWFLDWLKSDQGSWLAAAPALAGGCFE